MFLVALTFPAMSRRLFDPVASGRLEEFGQLLAGWIFQGLRRQYIFAQAPLFPFPTLARLDFF